MSTRQNRLNPCWPIIAKVAKKLSITATYGQRLKKELVDITHPIIQGIVGDTIFQSEYQFKTENCSKVFTRPELRHKIGLSKPILRKLEDMTENELRFVCDVDAESEILKIIKTEKYFRVDFRIKHPDPERNNEDGWSYLGTGFSYSPKELTIRNFHYLLSKGFDLFGLIDSGQSIDAKTINTKPL